VMRLPRPVRDYLHRRYCCECSEHGSVPSWMERSPIPVNYVGPVYIPEFSRLTAISVVDGPGGDPP